MKAICVAISFAFLGCGICQAADVDTEATADSKTNNKKEAVQFDGKTMELAFQADNPGSKIKEFLPVGQNLETWTTFAAIHEFPGLKDVQQYGKAIIQEVKTKYPKSPSSIRLDEKTGAALVDFVVWPDDGSFVEFNIFRCQKNSAGGLIAEQYALREYKDPEAFLSTLGPLRQRLLKTMAENGLVRLPADQAITAK